jgi:TolA-binding protein
MTSWLNHSWSLNRANKKKLTQQIHQFEITINALEEKLLYLLSNVQEWKSHVTTLTDLNHQLAPRNILQLRAMRQRSEEFQKALELLALERPLSHKL